MLCAIFKPAGAAHGLLPRAISPAEEGPRGRGWGGNAARNFEAIYRISFYQANDFPISHIDKDLLLTTSAH